jgi:MFS transporter, ACDE family, multidrug resistance protein
MSVLRQPKAVWATAFAATVGFTSIGLVDPILTSIVAGLNASQSQVSLLFTSYFAVTASMMLVTGYVSSRIGGRNTLLLGAALIAVFAGLSGASNSVGELVTFRAGWGLGNALFVAPALAVIVGAATGGMGAAILLYEAALGIGLSVGPLIGAALGNISWRYPFYGTAALMTIGFAAVALFLPKQAEPTTKTGLSDPIRALRHRGLAVISVSALFYNFGFFTVLAFAPFPMRMSAHAVGLVYFGWGALVALFSVIVAPRLQARFSEVSVAAGSLSVMALLLLVMAFGSPTIIAAAVIASGAVMGLNNTIFTAIALDVSPARRPVASAGYNFVRWIAGVIAPYAAPEIAERFGASVSFMIAAAAAVIALAVLVTMRHALGRFGTRRRPASAVAPAPASAGRTVLVAIDGAANDAHILAHAAAVARSRAATVQVVHVSPVEVFDDYAAPQETEDAGETIVDHAVATLRAAGVIASGERTEEVSGRASQVILNRAAASNAFMIVLGAHHRHDGRYAARGSIANEVIRHADKPVLVIPESDDFPGLDQDDRPDTLS